MFRVGAFARLSHKSVICICVCTGQTKRDVVINKKHLKALLQVLNSTGRPLTVTVTITRGPCWALGHVRSCSVSHSMSHSAHSVTSLDLSGKQDVRKANSDERAILGMKMKKESWKICFWSPNLKFSTSCSAFFFFFVNGSF